MAKKIKRTEKKQDTLETLKDKQDDLQQKNANLSLEVSTMNSVLTTIAMDNM